MVRIPATQWLLPLPLVALTCQQPIATTEPPIVTEASPVDPTLDTPSPAAEPSHPLELVPARARLMLMARSPQRFAEIWERERIAGLRSEEYEQLVSDMRDKLGYDLLDPMQLAKVGVDITAPFGFAVLSFRDEALVFFGGSPDPQPLIDILERGAGHPLLREALGSAELVVVDEELTLVLRNGMFAFVFIDRRRRQGSPNYAREVARIDPSRSLAHAPSMKRAHTGLPDDADIHGLLDLAGIVHDELERSRIREHEELASIGRTLAEARQRGARPEELEQIQRNLQSRRASAARRRRERQMGELMLQRTLGSVEGIGLTADASAAGLQGRLHVALHPDSVFRELLVTDDDPPSPLLALDRAPQLVLSTRIDVGVAMDLISQIALSAGESYAELNEELRRDLRIDLDRELRPLLDGRGSFVLTMSPPEHASTLGNINALFGGIGSVGITDEVAARAVLDHLAGAWPELDWKPAPEINGYSFAGPEDIARLSIGVVAGRLAIGPELAPLRRLHEGRAGMAAAAMASPETWQRLTTGPASARLAMHHRVPILLFMAMMDDFDELAFAQNIDFQLEGEFPDQDLHSIPHGSAMLRLIARRDRAVEATRSLQRQQRGEHRLATWRLAESLGITAFSVREIESGLLLEGGHYLPGGMGKYVETIMSFASVDQGPTSVDEKLRRARAEGSVLEERLLEARRKELRRAAKNP